MVADIVPIASSLQVVTSNRMEHLAQGLAELLRDSPLVVGHHPLCPETVMVQSKGMQRWISMALARINGICANVQFPFPNAFLDRLYSLLVGAMPEFDPYSPQPLSFRIHNLLPDLVGLPEFEPLRVYLSDRNTPLKQYQLACKLADMFDQYAVFRPDMLIGWEAEKRSLSIPSGFAWQAILWRRIAAEIGNPHRTTLHMILIEHLMDSNPAKPLERLPARLMLFGISHLPPFHLQVLEALARRIPVYVFLLNPCRHYWFDIVSDKRMVRRRVGHQNHDITEKLHLERGNRLLASLGLLGQQFLERIHQNEPQVTEAFQDEFNGTLLGRIQQDILDLVDRPSPENDVHPSSSGIDGSVQVHSCHSPMREVEVLYDQLLEMLANDEQIQPRDILVMAPDINLYSPYIHAVFGAPRDEQKRIPFSITDQSLLMESPVAETFVQLLDLAGGRFEATRVINLLQCPAIGEKFGIAAADLPIVERWIETASIRWGWDADERRQHGLPGYRENTWRTGLDRLIMGYAFAPERDRLFSDILPHDGIGSGESRLVGALAAFAETLHDCLSEMEGSDSLDGWHVRLNTWLDRLFLANDEKEVGLKTVRSTLDQIKLIGQAVPHTAPLVFEVVRAWAKSALHRNTREAGFMAGGVTFCALLPMRSIPAQVICILGMNHDAYPREQRVPGFDLIALEPRPGDRSKRHDDRYLFLEALISARKRLYISYVGQNIEDNTSIPPSVLVEELLEYVAEGFGISADMYITKHPLHGFSTAYFDASNPHLFSYAEENKEAAGLLALEGQKRFFFNLPLPPPQAHRQRIDWEDLCAFFAHPTRYLLEQRLGIRLKVRSDNIEDRELFTLDALDRYRINHRILRACLAGKAPSEIYEVTKAAGMLPHGTAGSVLFMKLGDEVSAFLRAADLLLPDEKPRQSSVQVALPPFTVDGTLAGIYTDARIVCLLSNMGPKDLLKSFICHLALQLASDDTLPKTTILICKDAVWRFGPLKQPVPVFQTYLDLFWQGLQKPLHFSCRTSFEYAKQLVFNRREPRQAMKFAKNIWLGNDFSPGEGMDPYLIRCFGDCLPFGPEFEMLAMKVFEPLLCAGEQVPVDK